MQLLRKLPEIIDPETTFIRLTTDFKYDSDKTTKDVSTLRTNIRNAISTYNEDTLKTLLVFLDTLN